MINSKKRHFNKITVHNKISFEIPESVLDLLSLGKNYSIGSDTDISEKIFTELDKCSSKFQSEARKEKISEIDIAGIKSNAVISGIKINQAKTHDPKVKDFKQF